MVNMRASIRKLVAQNKSEMTQKPIDVYTIPHMLMGIVSYIVFYLFLASFFKRVDTIYLSLISVLIWAIMWEYVENFILLHTRFKTNNRRDSLQNSLTDVVFTGLGGILALTAGADVWFLLIGFICTSLYNWVFYNHVMG